MKCLRKFYGNKKNTTDHLLSRFPRPTNTQRRSVALQYFPFCKAWEFRRWRHATILRRCLYLPSLYHYRCTVFSSAHVFHALIMYLDIKLRELQAPPRCITLLITQLRYINENPHNLKNFYALKIISLKKFFF